MKCLSFTFILIILIGITGAQITGKQAVAQMRRGINIGNTLDAPSGETTWGNPAIQEYYFDDYKDAGFTSIRIPVTWNKHTKESSPYTINQTFLDRVETVINWGLARGLYIIVNAHHEGWIKNDKDCIAGNQCGFTKSNQDRFNSIWKQISERFKNKSYKLIFEILNEPEGMSLANLNILQARVIKTIRNSGGNNSKRLIVFAGTKWSSGDELTKVTIPESDHTYLIANYHQYSPWNFVHDQSGTKIWGSESDKNSVKQIFDKVKAWANNHDIAVMFNEWGAGFDHHDYNSVMNFYQYYVQCAAHYNFSPFAWDDGGQFRTYDRQDRKWHSDLIDILTNPMLSRNGMKAVGWFDAHDVVRKSSDSGNYVGNIGTGSWVAYQLNIPKQAQYSIEIQLSSISNTGVISIEGQGGSPVYSLVKVPNTGGWSNWQSVKSTISLNAGEQKIILAAKVNGYNLKKIKLTKLNQNEIEDDHNFDTRKINEEELITTKVVDIEQINIESSCPQWQPNTNYPLGTVVSYQEKNYTSTYGQNSKAGQPDNAEWGWKQGGTCLQKRFIETMLQKIK